MAHINWGDGLPSHFDAAINFAVQLVREKNPHLDIQVVRGMPGGDYTDVQIRQRGIREFKTWRVSNTQLVSMNPMEVVKAIEGVANNNQMPSMQVIEQEPKGGTDVWAENWSKTHGKK